MRYFTGRKNKKKEQNTEQNSSAHAQKKQMTVCLVEFDVETAGAEWDRKFDEESQVFYYVCKTCNECFFDQETLGSHLFTHAGENPLICGFCSERFFDDVSLERHLSMHSGMYSFACNQCIRLFPNAQQLSEHQKTHNGGTLTVSSPAWNDDDSSPLPDENSISHNEQDVVRNVPNGPTKRKKPHPEQGDSERLNGLLHIPAKNKDQKTRDCVVCSDRRKKGGGGRKTTTWRCETCPSQPSMCIDECFKKYHTLRKYRSDMSNLGCTNCAYMLSCVCQVD